MKHPFADASILDIMALIRRATMQRMSAREAKNGFGRLIDTARAEPVAIEKHGRPVVVVLSVEEYERLASGNRRAAVPNAIAKPQRPRKA